MKPALWLGLVLACGGALAVAWLPEDEPAAALTRAPRVDADQTRPISRQAPLPAPDVTQAAPAVRTRQAWPDLAAGARAAWSPPPKPVPPAPPPPPPAPPPAFPYQWLGQLQDGGVTRWFIASPQQTLAVAAGDTVDQHWRVEGSEGSRLRVTWLPTGASVLLNAR